DALLGIALAKKYENNNEVEANARKALEVNPNLVPAINLMAEIRIQEENYEEAIREVRRALAVNPSDLEALSLVAVYHQFRGDQAAFTQAERRVLEIHPSFGRLYFTIAESLPTGRTDAKVADCDRKLLNLAPN